MEIWPLTCYVPDWLKCMISLAPFQGRCLFDWCQLHDPVEVPAIGDAFSVFRPVGATATRGGFASALVRLADRFDASSSTLATS
jgi:hypothetical protein